MSLMAKSIQGRMLCASACAYTIDCDGCYAPPEYFSEAVGWIKKHPPVSIVASDLNIDACLIGVNKDGIIVAFRGTIQPHPFSVAALSDWLHGIVESTPRHRDNIPGCLHDSTLSAVESIWPRIIEPIEYFHRLYPKKPLFLTGHSKGGAMAIIAAAKFHFNHPDMLQPSNVYTFGTPHPGDGAFAQNFPFSKIPVTRYENYLDAIPFLPPGKLFFRLTCRIPIVGDLFDRIVKNWNYVPLGKLQYVTEDHRIVEDDPGLTVVRLGEIVAQLVQGKDGLKKLAEAHYQNCQGYMATLCPDVCRRISENDQ